MWRNRIFFSEIVIWPKVIFQRRDFILFLFFFYFFVFFVSSLFFVPSCWLHCVFVAHEVILREGMRYKRTSSFSLWLRVLGAPCPGLPQNPCHVSKCLLLWTVSSFCSSYKIAKLINNVEFFFFFLREGEYERKKPDFKFSAEFSKSFLNK